ncbi:hypothetical protein D3C87_1472110 [compost metagenome]
MVDQALGEVVLVREGCGLKLQAMVGLGQLLGAAQDLGLDEAVLIAQAAVRLLEGDALARELRFGLLAGRDVLEHHQAHAWRVGLGREQGRRRPGPGDRSVLAEVALLQLTEGPILLEELFEEALAELAVVRVGQVVDRKARQVLIRVAAQGDESLVGPDDGAARGQEGHADGARLEDHPQVLLALVQLGDGLLEHE